MICIDAAETALIGLSPYCAISHKSAVYTMGVVIGIMLGTVILLLGFKCYLITLVSLCIVTVWC